MSDVTEIVSFGDGSSAVSSAVVVELDSDMHLDGEGNVITEFGPEDEVYFLVPHRPGITIKALRSTDDSDIQRIGEVTRTRSQQITFEHPAHLVQLSYFPAGQPSGEWHGRSSNLVLHDDSGGKSKYLQADLAPCLGDISYSITATQFLSRPPAGLSLLAGEEWLTDIVVEYEEVD